MKSIAFFFLISAGLNAGTIVVSQGATPGDYSQGMTGPGGYVDYLDVGFTTGSSSYNNVEIDATLQGDDSGGDSVDAYLTTSLGNGTTSPAYATVTDVAVPYEAPGYTSVTLFTGLSLAANTSYYLTIAPDDSDKVTWGIDDGQPPPVTDTGVSEIAAQFCTPDIAGCADFPPASNFVDFGANPIFSVTAQSSTPEPSTAVLFGAGISLVKFGIRSRRRRP